MYFVIWGLDIRCMKYIIIPLLKMSSFRFNDPIDK